MADFIGDNLSDSAKGTPSDDLLVGRNGSNQLAGAEGHDTLIGGTGEDWLEGGAGNDSLVGGAGLDILKGGAGRDTLNGGSGGDRLEGGSENDHIIGGGGSDVLYGEQGNDSLEGGTGVDFLYGGSGADTLAGGADGDLFKYREASESGVAPGQSDTIVDFQVGLDKIDLSALGKLEFVPAVGNIWEGPAGDTLAKGNMTAYFDTGLGKTVVEAALDDNPGADMRIELEGNVHLSQSDFIV